MVHVYTMILGPIFITVYLLGNSKLKNIILSELDQMMKNIKKNYLLLSTYIHSFSESYNNFKH